MANIIEAKSSDEVKAAIDAAVLPVGSSSIKRETNFQHFFERFTLGAYAGTEYLPALKSKKSAFSMGVTAPVGIAFSWGNNGNGKRDNPPKTNSERGGKKPDHIRSID